MGGLNAGGELKRTQINQLIDAVTLDGAALGNLGTTETIDLSNGQVQYGTLDAATVIALPALSSEQQYLDLVLTQDGTGGRVPTFYCADGTPIEWVGLGGQAPRADFINTAPYTPSLFVFRMGNGRIIGELRNPRLDNIIATPELITDPREVSSSLAMWIDAADRGTINMNGSTVASIADKSGHSHHVSQATGANQPSVIAMPNGLPGVRFTTNGSSLAAVDGADFRTTSADIWIIMSRHTDSATFQYIAHQGTPAGADRRVTFGVSSGDQFNFAAYYNNAGVSTVGRNSSINPVAISNSTTYGLRMELDEDSSHAANWHDYYASTGQVDSAGTMAGTRYVGGSAAFTLGIGTSGTSNVDIAEVLYFSDNLTSTQADKIEAYLRAKWGIQ